MASPQYNPYASAQYNPFTYPQIPHPHQHPHQQHPHSHPHPHPHPHPQISLDGALQQDIAQQTVIADPAPAPTPAPAHAHAHAPAPAPAPAPASSPVIQPDHQATTPSQPIPIQANDTQTPEQTATATTATPTPGTATGRPRGRPKGSKTRPRRRSPSPGYLARNPAPPPAPLYRGPYATIDDAIFSLQLHCFTSGYGVSQMRGVREKLSNGKYDPEGPVIRKDFACDRGGREFQSKGTGQRKRESTKTGCAWRVAIRRLKREGDLWFMEVLQSEHNHEATPQHKMDTIPSYRRWQKENNKGIRTAIGRLTRAAQMPARQVAAYLRGEHPDPELDQVDKQILRALSMGDQEQLDPADSAAQAQTVFSIFARKPCIILREDGTPRDDSLQQTPQAPQQTQPQPPQTPTPQQPLQPQQHQQQQPQMAQQLMPPMPQSA